MLTDPKIRAVAKTLWEDLYEAEFRGKDRGRFCLSRSQMKSALGVERLHASDIVRLQDVALELGLVIVDLDDVFACVEANIVRGYRRPPSDIFEQHFPSAADADDD